MTSPDFWEDQEEARETLRQLSSLNQIIERVENLEDKLEEQEIYFSFYEEETDQDLLEELQTIEEEIQEELDQLELNTLLAGEYDRHNAIVSLHPGAGGAEAQDWVGILLRMYLRYFEKKDWQYDMLDYLADEEAGVKTVTLLVKGEYAYGTLKGEKGVHRLVRISPFDSSGKRHTSFASVDVIPDVEEDFDIEIDESELKIETYRAGGAGGQHVNKTDSAVRITHLPSNIVVQCQNERSQHHNKVFAMKILKSKLAELEMTRHEEKIDEIRGEQKEIAWGHQIRSYVFHPYNLVKDLRTGEETGNIHSVIDGDLDFLVQAYLKWQVGRGK